MSAPLLFLHGRLRVEEKLLLSELQRREIPTELQDVRKLSLSVDRFVPPDVGLVWDRCLSYGLALAAMRSYAATGVPCLNEPHVLEVCGDKLNTHLHLTRAGLPTPATRIAFSPAAALQSCAELGWPVVLKPTIGSWGRLVSKLNDLDAAEALFEHRELLGNWTHQSYYLQEFIAKPDRDLRVFVIGGEAVAGIERRSEHWITNTARGATTGNLNITSEIGDLATRSAEAVGGGQVAVDLVERPGGELLVLEVNHSMEFRNSIDVTGVNIPALMVEDALRRMRVEALI
ncbi:MAG: lysine biosynthesis protein LysX [Planctomycetes bacterium]|nr:lysine biosynthesis protein LysX [Planctomycetota bacterium]